ncbi:MAG TPA: hypothetical protein VJ036_03460 [bacterium]|nr:hypothetical protein [bacterium]
MRIDFTENAQECHGILTDLIDRGLWYEDGLLAVVGCWQLHKMQSVLDYLPIYKKQIPVKK